MNQDLKNFLTYFWHGILLFTLGIVFNTMMALISVVFPITIGIVPLVTGYGLYQAYLKLKKRDGNE